MNFKFAQQKIQDLMSLYDHLDTAPNRAQWHFEPNYKNGTACAFVFGHTNNNVSQRYESLNILSKILLQAGIKNALVAKDGLVSDIIIEPEHTDLARKMFARYQMNNRGITKTYDTALEQEWLRQRTK